jgi:hypothetical protein
MKRISLTLAALAAAVSLNVFAAGCSGSASASGGGASASAEVDVAVDVEVSGNAKFDKFFSDVNVLYKKFRKAERALDRGPAALAKAAGLAETTDFKAALEAVAGKLKGKVTVQINITETGATATIAAAAGVTLSAEEQAMIDAYKEAVLGIAEVPGALGDLGVQVAKLIPQVPGLVTEAKAAAGNPLKAIKIVASVTKAVPKLQKILPEMKDRAPGLVEKSKTYITTIKSVTIG